jgi:hypothetical protein
VDPSQAGHALNPLVLDLVLDRNRREGRSGAYLDPPFSITSMYYPVMRELLRSCHPIPSVAVSSLSAGLAALAGLNPS